MADKFLDSTGVALFWEKIKNLFVQKDGNKVLSTNDYTTAEKTKLSGIATGAQVNVLEGVQVNGTTITPTNKIANIPAMGGASSSAAGSDGVVPKPAAGDQAKFLRGDGTWQTPTNTTYSAMTAAEATTGTATTARSITAKVLNDKIDEKITAAQVGAAMFQGTISANTTISNLTSYKKGWYWVVGTAGTYVGETCEAGDMIFCVSDRGSAYSASDFSVVQNNLNISAITNAELDAICV